MVWCMGYVFLRLRKFEKGGAGEGTGGKWHCTPNAHSQNSNAQLSRGKEIEQKDTQRSYIYSSTCKLITATNFFPSG